MDEAIRKLRVIRRLLEALSPQDPELEPSDLVADVTNHADVTVGLARQVMSFDPIPVDAQTTRANLHRQIEAERDFFTREVAPRIVTSDEAISGIHMAAVRLRNEIEELKNQASEATREIRKSAGESAATDVATHCEKIAMNYAQLAFRYLSAFSGSLAATVVLGLLFATAWPVVADPKSPDRWIEYGIGVLPRIAALGFLGYITAFLGRNYRINKHLQIANRQRAIALQTYPLLQQAAKNDFALDRIVPVLVAAIFADVESGYLRPTRERTVIESFGIGDVVRAADGK